MHMIFCMHKAVCIKLHAPLKSVGALDCAVTAQQLPRMSPERPSRHRRTTAPKSVPNTWEFGSQTLMYHYDRPLLA